MLANDNPGIIEKLLMKLFPRFDIVKQVDGQESLYLRRFHIIKKSRILKLLSFGRYDRLYIHHIARHDEDRHLHDHPWDFAVLILKGGYTEEIPAKWSDNGFAIVQWRPGMKTKKKTWKPFSFRRQPCEQLHRICPEGFQTTWTLFLAGPKQRKWGFMEEKGWTPWDEYLMKYCPEQMKGSDDPNRQDPDSL